jgi:hypothetical protein
LPFAPCSGIRCIGSREWGLDPNRRFSRQALDTSKLKAVLARRLLLFAAVLLLLATLAAGVAPRQPLPEPPPSALPAAPGRADAPVERRISAEPGARTAVSVRQGQLLRLEVTGDVLDSVELQGLDRMDGIEPLTPARFEVLAERPGVYPIRLVEEDRPIGRLVIRR